MVGHCARVTTPKVSLSAHSKRERERDVCVWCSCGRESGEQFWPCKPDYERALQLQSLVIFRIASKNLQDFPQQAAHLAIWYLRRHRKQKHIVTAEEVTTYLQEESAAYNFSPKQIADTNRMSLPGDCALISKPTSLRFPDRKYLRLPSAFWKFFIFQALLEFRMLGLLQLVQMCASLPTDWAYPHPPPQKGPIALQGHIALWRGSRGHRNFWRGSGVYRGIGRIAWDSGAYHPGRNDYKLIPWNQLFL